ncbi:glutathione S-transferase 1-like [Contarinia nasturtii]|uniref:glutathione S-transferase 1-like n=1 Tax=Contarinia nasturtii TaxID=265458 RepID=UPI0012D483FD|nr:glutathione S-transferase 1-like [Contarinia nasturtii]
MSNKLVLYNLDLSPPVRVVKTVAKLLNLELELRDVDLLNGEHLKEPYIKLNPEHTVPTLVDGDFAIWDSHTICAYLVDKYAKDDALYPKDLQLRAKCNQRLFFDAASLFVRLRDCSVHVLFDGGKEIPQDKITPMYAAYDILEAFLATDPFLVGNHLTIADISVSITALLLEVYAPIPSDKYPKITAWLKRISKTIPFFDELNASSTEQYRQLVQSTLEKNKQN